MDSDEAYLIENISLDDIIVTERHSSNNNLLLKKTFTSKVINPVVFRNPS
jgi:hypothetical protein